MPCCKSIIPLIVAALRFIENMSFESRKQSLSAMWSPHCGVPHSQMRASETCSLCQHCGDVHAIFGALPQLSLRNHPPPAPNLLASFGTVAWKSAPDMARMQCAKPNHNTAQTRWWWWSRELMRGMGVGSRICDCVSICECAFICRNMRNLAHGYGNMYVDKIAKASQQKISNMPHNGLDKTRKI